MKPASVVLVLGLVSWPGPAPVHGEAQLEPPEERRHLGFVLAQGPSAEPRAAMPGYSRDQGAFDGEMSAEFKGTRWWWLSGYVCGFSIFGLMVSSEEFAAPDGPSMPKKEYEVMRERGIEYVQGYREAYGRQLRKRRERVTTMARSGASSRCSE